MVLVLLTKNCNQGAGGSQGRPISRLSHATGQHYTPYDTHHAHSTHNTHTAHIHTHHSHYTHAHTPLTHTTHTTHITHMHAHHSHNIHARTPLTPRTPRIPLTLLSCTHITHNPPLGGSAAHITQCLVSLDKVGVTRHAALPSSIYMSIYYI